MKIEYKKCPKCNKEDNVYKLISHTDVKLYENTDARYLICGDVIIPPQKVYHWHCKQCNYDFN